MDLKISSKDKRVEGSGDEAANSVTTHLSHFYVLEGSILALIPYFSYKGLASLAGGSRESYISSVTYGQSIQLSSGNALDYAIKNLQR